MFKSLIKFSRNRLYDVRQKRSYISNGEDVQINLQYSKKLEKKVQQKLEELSKVIKDF